MRVVFDTNTVVSALLFRGSLAWLVEHWRDGEVAPLVCRETASELVRVLAYPKFGLSVAQADTALAHQPTPCRCRIAGMPATRSSCVWRSPDMPPCW